MLLVEFGVFEVGLGPQFFNRGSPPNQTQGASAVIGCCEAQSTDPWGSSEI